MATELTADGGGLTGNPGSNSWQSPALPAQRGHRTQRSLFELTQAMIEPALLAVIDTVSKTNTDAPPKLKLRSARCSEFASSF